MRCLKATVKSSSMRCNISSYGINAGVRSPGNCRSPDPLSVLEQLSEDYIRTARASGLPGGISFYVMRYPMR